MRTLRHTVHILFGIILGGSVFVSDGIAGDYPQLPEKYEESIIEPTPGPTVAPPSPRPTLPPPPRCDFYQADSKVYGRISADGSGLSPNPYTILHDGQSLSCLVNLVNNALRRCGGGGPRGTSFDDCMHGQLSRALDKGVNVYDVPRGFDYSTGLREHDLIFFDENCMPIDIRGMYPNHRNICEAIEFEYILSPISLLWEDTTTLPTEVSIVTFPLDPRNSGNSYIWRASAKLPLVVYDPDHTGVITSGEQLFGNWTFGGKKSDSGNISPWENGYEALKTLDTDKSGAVDGDELLPLGLWFDKNQDGISQPGEVQPLAAVGVTKLFFEISREDAKSGDLWAEKGYERVQDDEATIAPSVDWYVEGSKDSMALLSKIEARGDVCNSPSINQVAANSGGPSSALASPIQQLKLGGVWKWSMEGGNAGGVMLFDPNDRKGGKGTILTELFLKEGAFPGIRSRMNTAQIEGIQLSYYKDGTVNPNKFSFQAVTAKTRTENHVKVSGDGRSLSGSSKTDILEDGEVVQSITYRWSGTKM